MTDRPAIPLEEPDQIRSSDEQRQDGRPTGGDEHGLKPGAEPRDAPTIAPEEQGGSPSTEHAPGSDL